MVTKHKSKTKRIAKTSLSSWNSIIDTFAASWASSDTNINTHSCLASTSKQLGSKWFDCKTTPIQGKSILNDDWRRICSLLSTTTSDTDKSKVKTRAKAKPKPKTKKIIKKIKHGSKTTTVSITPKEKPKATRTFKYRIYPSKKQVTLYRRLFDTYRFIKNKTIEIIEKHCFKARKFNENNKSVTRSADPNIEGDIDLCMNYDKRAMKANPKLKKIHCIPSDKYLRNLLVNIDSPFVEARPWLQKIDYNFRYEVVRDCLKDYKSAAASVKEANKTRNVKTSFKMKFRSKKDDKAYGSSFTIHSKRWNTGWWASLLPTKLRCLDKRSNNKLPSTINYAARLKRYPGNKYFICIPQQAPPPKRSKNNLLVIDPGYRTCFTGINFRDNILEEIGDKVSTSISKKLSHLNKLISMSNDKSKRHRTRYHLKRSATRASGKIFNMIDDLHKSSAKYMCENFSTILVPKLNFHGMKNISKKQKSVAARVSHCRFVDCLINKSKQYRSCNVYVVDESYTSKTCSRCGYLHKDLGPSKIFKCPKCKVTKGRDENAVYNILMKALSDKKLGFGRA